MPKSRGCVKIKAPAKINLFLNVLRRRPDGYHDLHSVLQMVSLYDEIICERTRQGMTLIEPSANLPTDNRNLVIRAANCLARKAGITPRVRMTLIKRIPIGAGLGGGSSDAAATLVALNRLWGLGYSRAELAGIGQDLGSDVPFFLYGPAAFVTGRGEEVYPFLFDRDRWLVLINPGFEISTRWVYQHLTLKQFDRLSPWQNHTGSKKSWLTNFQQNIKIRSPGNFTFIYSDLYLYNDLERVTEPKYPIIREMKACLQAKGAEAALMSGSGPTVFGFFRNRARVLQAARKLKHEHPDWKVWAVKGLRRSPF